ncbi:NADH-quinone oxidoreductase subunit NuoF [Candidatus Sulfurimonas marisnigri]|uniref:NADH-quinone oxidoreductase subunit NuoF n=1 Tax=Candidatus Sulfurimonas marisnigri TaxID=2740405 RepID=A0A7S7LZL3_9BACT|nr:NADH-quinone oxidoreductase subunit NuoF [Candidatus Sulfurimonas marisnigri]QOY54339.1 NADH-quinone oxidoreductase subunit NuoF [Candidatus Sulfurimonas marisnigri]
MQTKIVSKNFEIPLSHTIDVALKNGRYSSLEATFSKKPQEIIDIIKQSNLRGKGGGGAPAGGKWQLASDYEGTKYLVVNADESEPGTFKDRRILSLDPHLLIEGIIATCYAIGSHTSYIYVRGEYEEFSDITQSAIDEAYEKNFLGSNAKYRVDITIHRGAGAYICGEKSALLESLEGKRGHPRLKPKSPEPEFYFGEPTLVNNVETIASVPFIIKNGADAYRAYGTEQSPGTLLFAISGNVNTPGVYEAEFGVSMMEYINKLGGGVKNGKKLKAVIPGGASTPIIPADMVESARLDYESLRGLGSSLGTGGMIVLDEDASMVKALKNLLRFYHHESCGQCTPCREGTSWVDKIMNKFVEKRATKEDLQILKSVSKTMNGKTICVFAPAASGVIDGFLKHFESEFLECIK